MSDYASGSRPTPDGAAVAEPTTYRFSDIAALCRCSVRTVHRWDDQRLIPGRFQIGRLVRFNRTRVDDWLKAGGPAPRHRAQR